MAYHPRATPNFRNLVVRPMWITLRAGLRTIPYIGPRFFSSGYHGKKAQMLDEETISRVGEHGEDVFFAQNAIPLGRGTIRVGDEVKVLQTGDPVYC